MKIRMFGAVAALSLTAVLLAWAAPGAAQAGAQARAVGKVEAACLRASQGAGDSRTSPRACGDLLGLAASAELQVRCLAIYALGELREVRAVDVLIANLADEDLHVRRISARALGKIGGERVAAPLVKTLIDGREDLNVRCVAAEALGMIGDSGCSRALLRTAQDEGGRLRAKSLAALQRTTGAPAGAAGLLSAK